jgi:hypothetical protein
MDFKTRAAVLKLRYARSVGGRRGLGAAAQVQLMNKFIIALLFNSIDLEIHSRSGCSL